MILPRQLPWGVHEIQPLEICVDFGPICGRDPRKGAPTLICICHRTWLCLSIALLLAVSWEGCHMRPLKIRGPMQIWSACWKICEDFKLCPQLGISRLDGVSSTYSPLLIYHLVTNLGLSQPLLTCRH